MRQLAIAFGAIALCGLARASTIPASESGSTSSDGAEELKSGHGEIEFRVRIDPSKKGQVLCGLYREKKHWLTHTTFRHAKTDTKSRWAVCYFSDVPKGAYAVAALHDEDSDGEMDKNFIGLPTEGYAMSKNAHVGAIGKPDWEDALFRHRRATTVEWAAMKY